MAVVSVITNAAVAIFTNLVTGLGGSVPKYMGIGTNAGNVTAARSGTALNSESYCATNDGTHNLRSVGTLSRTKTDLTDDTYSIIATATCPPALAPLSVKEAGIFDSDGAAPDLVSACTGGNMALWSTFDVITLQQYEMLQIQWSLKFS